MGGNHGTGSSPRGTPSARGATPAAAVPGVHSVLGTSWRSVGVGSPLAEQYLARDIAECSDDDVEDNAIDDASDAEPEIGITMYRRPSGVAFGGRPVFSPQVMDEPALTALERKQSRQAERSLLRDNHVLPPKHSHQEDGVLTRAYRRIFSTKVPHPDEESPSAGQPPHETSPLLGARTDASSGSLDDHLDEAWEQAVADHRIHTTWQRESKTIITYSAPLIMTFLLQYSINVTSVFAVGHMGKMELGAVSCKWPFKLLV